MLNFNNFEYNCNLKVFEQVPENSVYWVWFGLVANALASRLNVP